MNPALFLSENMLSTKPVRRTKKPIGSIDRASSAPVNGTDSSRNSLTLDFAALVADTGDFAVPRAASLRTEIASFSADESSRFNAIVSSGNNVSYVSPILLGFNSRATSLEPAFASTAKSLTCAVFGTCQ